MRSELLALLASISGTPLLLRPEAGHLPGLLMERLLSSADLPLEEFARIHRPARPSADFSALRRGPVIMLPTRADGAAEEPADEPWYVTEARAYEAVKIFGSIAVVPARGMLWAGLDQITAWCCGLCRPEAIQAACELLAARADVTLVVFDCDSPGGYTTAIPETAACVARLAAQKETLAFTAGMICSAMYWLMAPVGKIVVTPSSTIGCIGTYTTIYDFSKMYEKAGITTYLIAAGDMKGQGTPGVPVSKEFRAFLQENVDRINAAFRAACHAGRGTLAAADLQGQWFDGERAVEKNLADVTVATRAEFLTGLQSLLTAA